MRTKKVVKVNIINDMMGNPLSVNDRVAYLPPYTRQLQIGTVIKINPKTVRIENYRNKGSKCARFPEQIVRVFSTISLFGDENATEI